MILRYSVLALSLAFTATAQISSNASLSGKYYFREVLLAADSSANITDTRSASGTLQFNGAGSFTITAQQLIGTGFPAAIGGNGTYSVAPGGFTTLSDPLNSSATVSARLGVGALMGSSTETGSTVFSLLVAIPAPAQSVSNQTLAGPYWISSLEFPNGGGANVRDTNFKLTANGAGGFAESAVTGQARNLGNRLITQGVNPMSYSVSTDGTGTLTFPVVAGLDITTQLIQGGKNIYVSQDGDYFIGGSMSPGVHGLVVGVKASSSGATWNGLYFAAGLRYDTDPARLAAVVGSVNATSAGSVWTRRTRQSDGLFWASPLITYTLSPDGSGSFSSTQGHVDVGSTGQVFSTSGVDALSSTSYEIYFGARVPPQSGQGVFLHPQGIFNAASFAPPGFPVSPGGFVTLYGNFGAPTTQARTLPFPTNLGGVQVSVNGTAAPVYFVNSTQVSAVVPYAASGSTATFQVTFNGNKSNPVDVPLAPTAPGVFSIASNGLGDGAIQHPDYSTVSQSDPAAPGEILQVYMTGLGAVDNSVPDGAAAPSNPLARAVAPVNVFIGGIPATNIQYKGLTPGQASLYQINVQIPPQVGPGPQTLAVQTIDGFTDVVNVWVAAP